MNYFLVIYYISISILYETAAKNLTILPPLRQLAYDIQSSKIEIVDPNTIRINEFYINAPAESHAQFWTGKGEPSADGTTVPYQFAPLYYSDGANVTLRLPDGLSVIDVDYISVWDKNSNRSVGHVGLNERWLEDGARHMIIPKVLGPLLNASRGVSSGAVEIVTERSIRIPSFFYNGSGKKTNFALGSNNLSIPRLVLPNELNRTENLRVYKGEDVTITLPEGITLIDYDYFEIWDQFDGSFGRVNFNNVYISPDDFKKYKGTQYIGFNTTEGISSGPIILVNRNTFFVTNFRAKTNRQLYFWTGQGNTPAPNGRFVRNQLGVDGGIVESLGINFYLTLPDDIPDGKNYLAIWDPRNKTAVDYIVFDNRNSSRNDPTFTIDGRKIIRYPKCCDDGTMLTTDGCKTTDLKLSNNIPVHYANNTHLNDDPLVADRIVFVPYYKPLTCQYKYPLTIDTDTILLLTTGVLMVAEEHLLLNDDQYCLDILKDADFNVDSGAFLCFDGRESSAVFDIIIKVCVGLSAICLFLTASIYFVMRKSKKEDKRGASIAGFSGLLGVAFTFLLITQFRFGSQAVCNVLGFLFQFCIVSSLIWLDALCCEVYYYTKHYNNDNLIQNYSKRLWKYLAASLIFPLIFVIISLSLHLPVGLININLDKNCFLEDNKEKWLLYAPILAAIVVAIILISLSYRKYWQLYVKKDPNFKILERDMQGSNVQSNVAETKEEERRKFEKRKAKVSARLMLCLFLVFLMSICWIFEIITYQCNNSWLPLDILHALQGVFVLGMVLSTGNIFKEVKKNCLSCQRNTTNDNQTNGNHRHLENNFQDDAEMQPLKSSHNNNRSRSN